jgi:hypothetical protein
MTQAEKFKQEADYFHDDQKERQYDIVLMFIRAASKLGNYKLDTSFNLTEKIRNSLLRDGFEINPSGDEVFYTTISWYK